MKGDTAMGINKLDLRVIIANIDEFSRFDLDSS